VDTSELEFTELQRALERNGALVAVHYACESFLAVKDRPVGIASIALHDLQTGDTAAFSLSDAPASVVGNDREIRMLERFFEEISARSDSHFLHWNMNRPEYGFVALLSRYEYLTGTAASAEVPGRRIDVDGLLVAQFGHDYAPHGKLESMARLNDLDTRSFKSGKTEAELYARGEWGAISRSSASKAAIIGQLSRLLIDGRIRTASSAGSVGFAGGRLDAVSIVLAIGDRMLLVQRSMRVHPHGGATVKFENEYDDQYLYRALLTQFFDDVRDEEYVPSYAGGNSRIDFLIPEYRLGVELKHTRQSLTDKEVGDQLMIDSQRYSQHSDVNHLICLVFDYEGFLRNPRALEEDLRRDASTAELAVTVRIYDR
jgi:hypothetical protein